MLNKVPAITLAFWMIKIMSTTVGETGADYLAVHVGLGTMVTDGIMAASTAVFAIALAATFLIWYGIERTLSIHTIVTRRRELFYCAAILFTFALGTAAGDLATEALQLGFRVGAVAFGALVALTTFAYYRGANPVLTFWIAYVLT